MKKNQDLAFKNIITKSQKMFEVLNISSKAAVSSANILILGETGTGKDLLAKAIHNKSLRSGYPFVAVNCAAIPEALLESELFGYKKGAFTDAKEDRTGKVESANKGTIFLDEIADLSLSAQSKILRIIENHELQRLGESKSIYVDVRIISATNQDLKKAIREKKFREDLFWRISEIIIKLPALRERKEDILLLAEHFISEFNKELNKKVKGISKTALSFLQRHHFPGNIRELRNIIRQGMILLDQDVIWLEHLPIDVKIYDEKQISYATEKFPKLSDIEKEHIKKALELSGNKKKIASELLGIGRTTLYEKIKEYKIK